VLIHRDDLRCWLRHWGQRKFRYREVSPDYAIVWVEDMLN
jgi:hypothetical protein